MNINGDDAKDVVNCNLTETSNDSAEEDEEIMSGDKDVTQLSDSIFVYPIKKISDHGNVFLGEIRSGVYGVRECAIKFARISEQNVKEARILTKLSSHTHIVSIIQSGIHKDMFEERVYIALDKCHKQNLRQHLMHQIDSGNEFNLIEALEYSKQIIVGMTYVHENLIIHKDLKPSNILLSHDKSTIKIADFGLSQEIESTTSKVYCKHQFGTNGFRPLESFGRDWASLKSDTFSLGALLYFLLSNGKSPFGDEITLWIYKTRNGDIDLSGLLVSNVKAFQHLLKLMLSKERCHRPSIWQVADHPCWTGNDIECRFDYGYAEEVNNSDVKIAELEEKDSSDHEIDTESYRQLLRVLKKMRYDISTNSEMSIIIFDEISKHLYLWNPKNKSVTRIHDFNERMKEKAFSSVTLGNHIYILSKQSLYRIRYGDVTSTWNKMNDFGIGLYESWPFPIAVVAGAMYVVGTGESWKHSIAKYDPLTNQWQMLKSLKKLETFDAAIVALKGFIYSIGGESTGLDYETTQWIGGDLRPIDRVERMSVFSLTWDEVARMNECRMGASAVECNEKIIVAGGLNHNWKTTNTVEKYDPDMNQWTIITPMTISRWRFRLHLAEGNIYAVGGNTKHRTIEKHDSTIDQWEIIDLGSEMKICESVTVRTKSSWKRFLK